MKTMPKKVRKEKIEAGIFHRTAQVESTNEEDRTIEFSFSSEEPVERWFGDEILDHDPKSVRMDWLKSGNAPLLANHDHDDQVGVIEEAELSSDKKGRCVARFGTGVRAEEFFQDARSGVRKNVSVGYRIHAATREEFSNDDDKSDVYRVHDWEPIEISIVSVPADQTVGIGRSESGEKREFTIANFNQSKKRDKMPENITQNNAPDANQPKSVTTKNSRSVEDILKEERERSSEIMALAEKHGFEKEGSKYISDGRSAEDFTRFILDNLDKSTSKDVRVADNPDIGMSDNDIKSFSILRAIQAVVTGNRDLAAFEFEASDAYRKKNKEKQYEGAFTIPSDVTRASVEKRSFGEYARSQRKQAQLAKRDMSVGNLSAGGYLVGTEHQPENFIDLLRSKMLVTQLGARVISGLNGNIAIPKLTGGITGYWVTEGSDVTEDNPTVGQVAMSPKTVGGTVDYTRKTILQSSPDIEAMLENDIVKVLARKIDAAAINGSGSNGEPTGILNTSGRGQVDYGDGMTWADVVDAETEVAADDADIGNLAYLFTVALRGDMKQTLKSTGVAGYIWENHEVNGYPAYATNQMPSEKGLFGNFEDIMIGEWSDLDINIDHVTLGKSGGHRIIALQDVDVAIRHPESFCEIHT